METSPLPLPVTGFLDPLRCSHVFKGGSKMGTQCNTKLKPGKLYCAGHKEFEYKRMLEEKQHKEASNTASNSSQQKYNTVVNNAPRTPNIVNQVPVVPQKELNILPEQPQVPLEQDPPKLFALEALSEEPAFAENEGPTEEQNSEEVEPIHLEAPLRRDPNKEHLILPRLAPDGRDYFPEEEEDIDDPDSNEGPITEEEVAEEKKILQIIKNNYDELPWLKKTLPPESLKGLTPREQLDRVIKHRNSKTGDLFLRVGFNTVMKATEEVGIYCGAKIRGASDTLSNSKEVNELLKCMKLDNEDKFSDISPEKKLLGIVAMTLMSMHTQNTAREAEEAARLEKLAPKKPTVTELPSVTLKPAAESLRVEGPPKVTELPPGYYIPPRSTLIPTTPPK